MDFKVDLTNCDREPIHIPGKIQQHGALLAIRNAENRITHVSENIHRYFNITPSDILNKSFPEFLLLCGIDTGTSLLPFFPKALNDDNESEYSIMLKTNEGERFHLIVHRGETFSLLELEPVTHSNVEIQDIMGTLLTRILEARGLKDTLNFCAQRVKEIIGYDRVMIYRFAEDGHGEVVAEAVNEGYESFYGLHYPASDIPKQARELYKRNLVRIIADVNSTDALIEVADEKTKEYPLDLTDSVLRAVSPIHIQYLKNMGVGASFSVSLLSNGELWGLIACHNYSPKQIDYKKRNSCKLIGQLLSTSLVFRESEENKEQRSDFNEKLQRMIGIVRREWDLPKALMQEEMNPLDLTEATGAAFLFEDKIYMIGETPVQEDILDIAKWLKEHTKNQLFQTNYLSSFYPKAAAYKDIASGLLSCAISRELNEYIFWFKKELPQVIQWAGNPNKPVELNNEGILSLSPRRSFEVFVQEVEGVSANWNSNEIAISMKLREELVHIINERANQIRKLNEQLKQAYDELDTFSFTISHDLKTPLSSIKNYSELLLESEYDAGQSRPMLEKIVKGADKMNLLIKEVLSYSRIGRQDIKLQVIDMKLMLEEIRGELLNAYRHTNPVIDVVVSPDIMGDYIMIYQVFINIIGNAVKYSSEKEQPVVTVNATINGNETTYSIADNGIGIDMKNGDQIFDLFKRMSNANSFEGTGVGLAIVKRILEKHHGRIWYESEPGNGTIFYICLKNKSDDKR